MSTTGLLDAVRIERQAVAKAHQLFARDHAPEFNVFDVIELDEVRLSKVIRWMLDSLASHGQGSAYVDLFFREYPTLGEEARSWRGAVARCEVATTAGNVAGRRIDVLLESADSLRSIVIENKPWAGWQELQLQSYWTDQRARHAKVLAFVGGVADAQACVEKHWRGNADASAWPSEDVIGVGYDRLADWADACAAVTRPSAVASFLRDFAKHARERIAYGASMMTELDATADVILAGGAERVRSGLDIEAAMNLVRHKLSEKLADQVKSVFDASKGWSIAPSNESSNVWGLTITNKTRFPSVLVFALFGRADHCPWVGFRGPDASDFHTKLGKQSSEHKWPWWRYLEAHEIGLRKDDASDDAWVDIEDGRMARDLTALATRLADQLGPALDEG